MSSLTYPSSLFKFSHSLSDSANRQLAGSFRFLEKYKNVEKNKNKI
jgi:hypothetical protein